MTIPTFTMPMDTPVGHLVLESDGDVLIGIWLPSQATTTRGDGHDAPPVLKDTVTQLEEYFAGERTEIDVPMELARWAAPVASPWLSGRVVFY